MHPFFAFACLSVIIARKEISISYLFRTHDVGSLQKLADAVSSLLSCLLSSLTGYYMLREAAAMPVIPWTQDGGVPLEAWIHVDGRHVPESVKEGMKPAWHIACKEEVGCSI